MTNTITFSRSTPTSDTVLIVMDGTPRTHTIAAQVLRDCDDFNVRQAAYAVLAKTGVVDG